jgi:hypothetical protein
MITEWADLIVRARNLRVRAIELEELAGATRCTRVDSAGSRCTADKTTDHTCRIDPADYPPSALEEV